MPLYLRPDNPTVRPLTSHNALTHNVLLKITVPRRTGRKRKRGSNHPFEGELDAAADGREEVQSKERIDAPKILRRKLRDNVDKYQVEPVGVIGNTHRYRGELSHRACHSTRDVDAFVQGSLISNMRWVILSL